MKQFFTHLHRVLPLVLVISFSAVLFTSCEKSEDDTFTPTPKNGLIGNWSLFLTGDVSTTIPLNIYSIPSETGSGSLSISDGYVVNDYRLVVKLSENGELDITAMFPDSWAGRINGTLTKNGTGSGVYNINFESVSGWYTLTGNWTASKN